MKRSLFFKVFAGYLFTILALAGLVFIFSSRAVKSFAVDNLAANLEKVGRSLEPTYGPLIEQGRLMELRQSVREFGRDTNTRITVVDSQGRVLADSDEDPSSMVNHRYRPEIAAAFDGGVGRSIRFSNTVKEDMLYVGLPLSKEGRIPFVLRLSLYLKDVRTLITGLRMRLLVILLVISGLALIAAALFSKTLSRPLGELSAAARKIAAGDFSAKVTLQSKDEFRDMAYSFNDMAERIDALFKELSAQKDELKTITASMDEGLLSVDREGRILYSNPRLQKMVRSDSIDGKFYWEILRSPRLNKLVKSTVESRSVQTSEILLDETPYLVSADLVPSQEQIVLTFTDLSSIKALALIKKDFIANASHELRTPMTSIIGYVETLQDNLPDIGQKNRDYLNIISRNTDRMMRIVNDLLSLSELEERESLLEHEDVDMAKLVDNAAKLFKNKIEDKGLSLDIEITESLPHILGDPYWIEQMIINLLDNAVRYTEKGSIGIVLARKENALNLTVRDTGLGIDAESLPRIFERFYAVDKSRSRRQGGTGLGLSIVKHIVSLHGGDVEVESAAGKGSRFTVRLPLA